MISQTSRRASSLKNAPKEIMADLRILIAKNEVKTRDAPATFEIDAEFYHMQTVCCKYITALLTLEQVYC